MSKLDDLRNTLLTEKKQVLVFLINGVKLQGVIVDYNEKEVLLERNGRRQLIKNHAISTISEGGDHEK